MVFTKKGEEHQVGLGCFTRCQQVNTGISAHTPVVVLTTAIDAGKWFFMQQYHQVMPFGNPGHDVHQKVL
jgi:hypothetical protein